MKTTGIQVLRRLNVLLAVLLCSILAFATPVSVRATPLAHTTQSEVTDLADEEQQVLFAGEIASGEPEAVLQLDESLVLPVLQAFLQKLYPQTRLLAPAPHSYPASKGDCGLHTILTKGP